MNLTDEQIIKTIETCINDDHCGDCTLGYLSDDCLEFRSNLLSVALGVIKRKNKAFKLSANKIIDLKIKVKEQKAEIEELRAENRGFRKICDRALKTYKQTKAEAIKEFAERLKAEYIFWKLENGSLRKIIPIYAIDYLVKEMVGE